MLQALPEFGRVQWQRGANHAHQPVWGIEKCFFNASTTITFIDMLFRITLGTGATVC